MLGHSMGRKLQSLADELGGKPLTHQVQDLSLPQGEISEGIHRVCQEKKCQSFRANPGALRPYQNYPIARISRQPSASSIMARIQGVPFPIMHNADSYGVFSQTAVMTGDQFIRLTRDIQPIDLYQGGPVSRRQANREERIFRALGPENGGIWRNPGDRQNAADPASRGVPGIKKPTR